MRPVITAATLALALTGVLTGCSRTETPKPAAAGPPPISAAPDPAPQETETVAEKPRETTTPTDRRSAPVAQRPEPEPEPAPAAEPQLPVLPDPLVQMEREKALRESLALQRGRLEKKVADAEAKVGELETRLLAVKNPFLPRPQLPPDEEEAWKGLSGAERARRVEDQIAAAKEELEAARAELAALPSAP